jgi:hypothetical protein
MGLSKIGVLAFVAAAAACSSNSSNATPAPPEDAAVVVVEDAGVPEDAAAPPAAETGPAAEAGPAASTFTQVYTDIISPICVQCHNPQGIGVSMGHLDMSTQSAAFSDLVGVAAMGTGCSGMGTRVVAGNAADSILFKKVDPAQPAPCGAKMPLGLTPLTTAQADEIQSWINAGAMNN